MSRPHLGKWFEELSVGLVFQHALTRTVTETDNVLFTTLTLNPQPLHLDHEFAAATEFGRPLVNSFFTLGLVGGISVLETTHGTTVANLGMDETVFPAPVRRPANGGPACPAPMMMASNVSVIRGVVWPSRPSMLRPGGSHCTAAQQCGT